MIALLVAGELRERLFAPAELTELAGLGPVQDDLAGARVCITGWQTRPLTEVTLAAAPALGLVAHTGGSIRELLPESAYDNGIRVSHAAAVLAEAVAEFAVMQILAGLRDAVDAAVAMRAGVPWPELAARPPGRLLRDQTVGIVGASKTGQATLARLRPFGCRLLVCDPFLDPPGAAALGAHLANLDELVAGADVISLHAPLLPATRRMIGAAQLARMRPGAVLVNTARAGLTDEAALRDAVAAGRLRALLDVYHEEPLPEDSPWRTLPGVVATPHIAALTAETLREQGSAMVAEIRRFLAGEPLQHEVTREAYQHIA